MRGVFGGRVAPASAVRDEDGCVFLCPLGSPVAVNEVSIGLFQKSNAFGRAARDTTLFAAWGMMGSGCVARAFSKAALDLVIRLVVAVVVTFMVAVGLVMEAAHAVFRTTTGRGRLGVGVRFVVRAVREPVTAGRVLGCDRSVKRSGRVTDGMTITSSTTDPFLAEKSVLFCLLLACWSRNILRATAGGGAREGYLGNENSP
jgi:hypothetical protein